MKNNSINFHVNLVNKRARGSLKAIHENLFRNSRCGMQQKGWCCSKSKVNKPVLQPMMSIQQGNGFDSISNNASTSKNDHMVVAALTKEKIMLAERGCKNIEQSDICSSRNNGIDENYNNSKDVVTVKPVKVIKRRNTIAELLVSGDFLFFYFLFFVRLAFEFR